MNIYTREPSERITIQEQEKIRIRQRYKGIENKEDIVVLPCIEESSFYDDTRHKRVAVYVRVSTDSVQQTTSYELQKNYYERSIQQHPNWELVEIYADEGISGTSLKHRDRFIQMINDCREGKIDLILVKSVSRFSRNVVDCITEVRALAALKKPVGVYFESEGIYTLDEDSEMRLPMIATMAQEESHTKSRIMNTSYEMRFSQGIFLTPPLLGYDNDENSHLVINPEEARTVKLIFFLYLYGYSTTQIASALMKLQRLTKKGNQRWTSNTVLAVLQNERHCGDVLARKTWTPNYLDHKSKKNHMNKNQYLYHDDHEAIISRDDFIAVQHLIANAKYGYRGLLPQLHVVESGALKGFVAINTKWASFTADDYLEGAKSIDNDHEEKKATIEKTAKPGDFDLRGYEVTRAQFIQTQTDISATFSSSSILFSKPCISKLNRTQRIELLFDPLHQLFAIRASTLENRHSVLWTKNANKKCVPRSISGSAFLPTFYQLLGWKVQNRYRVRGVRRQKENETVLLFNLKDTEIIIPIASERYGGFDPDLKPVSSNSHSNIIAYPASWADSFGTEVYAHEFSPELTAIDCHGQGKLQTPGTPVQSRHFLAQTSREEIKTNIEQLLQSMKKEAFENG